MQLTRTNASNQTIFDLSGGFMFSDHATFRPLLNAIDNETIKHITINLYGVEFIDSAGLGMLLLARERAAAMLVSLTLANPQNQVKKVFDLSQFEKLFTIISD